MARVVRSLTLLAVLLLAGCSATGVEPEESRASAGDRFAVEQLRPSPPVTACVPVGGGVQCITTGGY